MSIDRRKLLTTTTAGVSSAIFAGCTGLLTEPANVRFATVSHPDTIEHDEEVHVDTKVENTGGETGEATIVLRVSDDVVDVKDVSVEGGATVTTSFTISGSDYADGSHALTASIDEDTYESTIEITEPDPAFLAITGLEAPRTVDHDESIGVTVSVSNTGDLAADQDLVITAADGTALASESVSVEPGSGQDVAATVPAGEFFSGDHTLTAATSDDDQSVSITVTNPNPYDKQSLVVSLEQRTPAIHDMQDIISDALGYWDDNAEQYAGYPVSYNYRANASDPDVEIIVVDEILNCGDHTGERVAGCAPLVEGTAPQPATVRIVDGYRKEWMTTTLIHELGHTLGLGHTAEPAHIMSNEIEDRIPDYDQRLAAIDAYVSAFDPYRDGGDDWDRSTNAWSSGEFVETETAADEAADHYRETQRAIADARDTANALDEDTAHSRLDEVYQKARAMRLASEAAARMGREAQETYGDPEPHRQESNEYVSQANQYTFYDSADIRTAFGFPNNTR